MSQGTLRRILPLPVERVCFTEGFWARRLEVNRAVTLPAAYEQCKRTGRIDAWKLDWKPGRPKKPHIFWDSDVAKWIEAAAYIFVVTSLTEEQASAEQLLDLYRFRWQIELAFKRMKGLLELGVLPAKDPCWHTRSSIPSCSPPSC